MWDHDRAHKIVFHSCLLHLLFSNRPSESFKRKSDRFFRAVGSSERSDGTLISGVVGRQINQINLVVIARAGVLDGAGAALLVIRFACEIVAEDELNVLAAVPAGDSVFPCLVIYHDVAV